MLLKAPTTSTHPFQSRLLHFLANGAFQGFLALRIRVCSLRWGNGISRVINQLITFIRRTTPWQVGRRRRALLWLGENESLKKNRVVKKLRGTQVPIENYR